MKEKLITIKMTADFFTYTSFIRPHGTEIIFAFLSLLLIYDALCEYKCSSFV